MVCSVLFTNSRSSVKVKHKRCVHKDVLKSGEVNGLSLRRRGNKEGEVNTWW